MSENKDVLGLGAREYYINLDVQSLVKHALANDEGVLTNHGALTCMTGKHTGRSPKDKFTVKDSTTADKVDWGSVNQPMLEEHFQKLRQDQLNYLHGKRLYVCDSFAGAEKDRRISVRCINEDAWSNLFAKQLFRRPSAQELSLFRPEWTIIHTPNFMADKNLHGTKSETFIVVNFTHKLVLIGGTKYAGEIKKSVFGILNYLYPFQGVLPMHCSANISKLDNTHVALFFGLSGTGKTTLSADPERRLIGDDEHGWSDKGVFNFEGGCYAKCINLSEEKEPQIWRALRDGAILENVVIDAKTKVPNFDDDSITENTRAAYPLEYIENAVLEGTGPHPKHVVFLTCDAFGVMPPISKLSTGQAMYHFLSGYTAKVAGTEQGMGDTPEATFSACFGSPFLPLKPTTYAELLGKRMNQHKVDCWLINTGWIGGGQGIGSRISLKYTRQMVSAALNGELANVKFIPDPIFGLPIPETVPGVPTEILIPRNAWKDKVAYDTAAKSLAQRFRDNFKKFSSHAPDVEQFGPK